MVEPDAPHHVEGAHREVAREGHDHEREDRWGEDGAVGRPLGLLALGRPIEPPLDARLAGRPARLTKKSMASAVSAQSAAPK